MNAETLKRIVRAIADGSQDDLGRLARKVVDAERLSGHTRLADELDAILNKPQSRRSQRSSEGGDGRGLKELPLSRRDRDLLATQFPRESLEHHMVLPSQVEARFERIEREYAARERLGAYGLKPRKTILIYGPPGCGKSLGAKRLAWNTGLSLMKVRFDALISSYFGESAANLRSVFEASKARPCVLLLDECDFIARSRVGSKDVGEASRIVNTLLQLMEDYDSPGLLVATTNIQDSLDEALFRRFDDVFQIPLPGPEQIDQLLRLTLSAVQVSNRLDWNKLVSLLEGASSAQVVKAAMDAAKAAVLNGQKLVEESHVRAAIGDIRSTRSEEARG